MKEKDTRIKFACYILAVAICVFLSVHWINLSKRKSEIEKIKIAIVEIEKLLSDSAKISFHTNQMDNSKRLELYFETQFVITPVILVENLNMDTILSVQKKGDQIQHLEKYDTILAGSAFDLNVSLLKKMK